MDAIQSFVIRFLFVAALLMQSGLSFAQHSGAPAEAVASLKVSILPITPIVGSLRISLCDNEQCYKSRGSDRYPYLNETRKDLPTSKTVRQSFDDFEFKNLKPGFYSVFIHHDRDNDGKVDSKTCGILGKPIDGIGYSKNIDPRSNWGEPKWNQVKQELKAGQALTISITTLYMCD